MPDIANAPVLPPTTTTPRSAGRAFLDGAWAGLAAALIGLLVYFVAGGVRTHDSALLMGAGLKYATIGLALGPAFALLMHYVPLPLLPAGIIFALAFGLGAGARDATTIVPLIIYGATLGLVLRHRDSRRTITEDDDPDRTTKAAPLPQR